MDSLSMVSRPEPAIVAPRAGADLRAARERLAWPLQDAAASLHIRTAYLEALEEGELSRLPGNAYALGFLRSYASALGLDPAEMLRRFKAEAAEVTHQTELAFPAPVPERGMPAGAVILVGLILAAGVYAGWYRLSGEGRLPAEAVTAIPEKLATLAEQALPPWVPPPAGHAVAPVLVAVEAPPLVPMLSPSSAAAALVTPDQVLAAPTIAPLAVPLAVPPNPDQPRILLRASADAWMQVRDRTGASLLNKVLKAGETWAVPPRAGLLLTIGNAAGTEILVDGVVTPGLGAAGVVRRDLPLDPDQIKDGKLAASAMRANQ